MFYSPYMIMSTAVRKAVDLASPCGTHPVPPLKMGSSANNSHFHVARNMSYSNFGGDSGNPVKFEVFTAVAMKNGVLPVRYERLLHIKY
jgi:hypothetical protein